MNDISHIDAEQIEFYFYFEDDEHRTISAILKKVNILSSDDVSFILDAEILECMPNLEELTLKNEYITYIPNCSEMVGLNLFNCIFKKPNPFSRLADLEYLTITDFVEFAENYPPSISTLEMNNVGKTSIAKITALPNLTNLDLNNVTFLEDYAKFTGQLDTLIIDGCNLKTIEIVDGTCLKKLVIRNCPKLTALIGNFDWELINAAD